MMRKDAVFAIIRGIVAGFVAIGAAVFLSGCQDFKGSGMRGLVSQQPEDAVVPEGIAASFSVATREKGATYQWLFNGKEIPEATGPRLAGVTRIGLYSCRISVREKQETSEPAGLFMYAVNAAGLVSAVQGPFRPCTPRSFSCGGQAITINGYCGVTNNNNNSVWFPANGKTGCRADTFHASDCAYDTVVTARAFFNPAMPQPSCNDDAAGSTAPCNSTRVSLLSFPAVGTEKYSFTIYTKGTPIPPTGTIMKLNVNWTP